MRLTSRALALLLALSVGSACSSGDKSPTGTVSTGTLKVQNSSNRTIERLFYSDCASTVWGPERLQGAVISPNGTKQFTVDAGCYDVLAVATTGEQAEFDAQQVDGGKITTVLVHN